MALMVGAMLIAPALDAIAKLLMERLSPAQVGTGRFLMQSLVMLPLLILAREAGRPRPTHLLAGLFLGLAILFINMALQVMPVANAIAIFFVEPLILTLLAALILGERLGWRRLLAVAVGLVGVLIVLRPNISAYGLSALFPLATALSFACYMLVTRVMSLAGGKLALQFWTGLAAMATLATWMLIGASLPEGPPILMPNGHEAALFLGLGLVAALVHQMIVRALSMVEAGVAAPLQYLEIASATLLGWLIFGDFPDALTWLGTAIIIGAGIYVFHRERQLARAVKPPLSPP